MNKNLKYFTQAAMIAALYVVLTFIANAFGLASGTIQIRISEALTILPYFSPAAVPGLFIGCILANTLTGCAFYDVIFGSLATLVGACGTRLLRKHRLLTPIPPILSNTLIMPFVLSYVYSLEGTIPFFMITVGAGELISCGLLGILLLFSLDKYRDFIFS